MYLEMEWTCSIKTRFNFQELKQTSEEGRISLRPSVVARKQRNLSLNHLEYFVVCEILLESTENEFILHEEKFEEF